MEKMILLKHIQEEVEDKLLILLYQAWSYACLLEDFNENVQNDKILIYPCGYLHNYTFIENDPLLDKEYSEIVEKAPLYGSKDLYKLRNFISRYIKREIKKIFFIE